VRQAESLDLLIALNSGLPGMCTLHANSAREAIIKMCTLPLLAGENIGSRFVVPTVASSIDIVIHQALERDGVRRGSRRAPAPRWADCARHTEDLVPRTRSRRASAPRWADCARHTDDHGPHTVEARARAPHA